MLADRLEIWAKGYKQEGIQQGVQQGVQQGEALILQRQLTKRFGPISPDITARIAEASTAQLETWLDRIIDAPSLTAIFDSP